MTYQPGDVANGYVLGEDYQWHPLPPAETAPAAPVEPAPTSDPVAPPQWVAPADPITSSDPVASTGPIAASDPTAPAYSPVPYSPVGEPTSAGLPTRSPQRCRRLPHRVICGRADLRAAALPAAGLPRAGLPPAELPAAGLPATGPSPATGLPPAGLCRGDPARTPDEAAVLQEVVVLAHRGAARHRRRRGCRDRGAADVGNAITSVTAVASTVRQR
jgi:hypothetical protein